MRRLTLTLLAALTSCSSNPSTGSLRVVLGFEAGVKSTCVKLVARGSTDRESMPVLVAGKEHLVFGVAQLGEANAVDVQALGFADEACATRTEPREESEVFTAQYGSPTPEVRLTLKRVAISNQDDGGSDGGNDGGVDLDGDGFTSDVDCNDLNNAIRPNAAEQCGNQLDDDCDLAIDCADSACDQMQCRVGLGNRCVMGACAEVDCDDNLDNDFDGTTDCVDPDCNGAMCGATGTCTGMRCFAPTEVGLCGDGVDNDQDTFTDCEDNIDCPNGSTCSDADACTGNDTCSGGFCGAGPVLTCNMAPGACFSSSGTCQSDAGCLYPVNTNNSCDDGLFCTVNTCVADGGCEGVAKPCNSAPAGGCFAATGACLETDGGSCRYAPLPMDTMGTCSDSDNCTVGDSCDGDGGCLGGTRTPCTVPSECFVAGCDLAGACQISVRTGACTGGVCAPDGGCETQTIFMYPPSNFTEPELPATAGTMTINCTTTLNTQTMDGGTDWNTCPAGPAAPAMRILSSGAVLMFADALTVNAQLRLTGARPIIIAVRNDVTLNSTVNASSDATTGAGANAGCLPGERGGDGQASGTPETAGGGGGGAFGSNGGSGANGANGGPRGDAGVVMNTNLALTPLRGGCRGGNGGRAGANGGVGGRPGGAVQISAGGTFTINTIGSVQAGGEGGEGGTASQRVAGGGGGSGGAILLEGTSFTMNPLAVLAANGGAGGEGSGGSATGTTGQNGLVSGAAAQCFAVGGACGGNGGDGAARSSGAENGFAPAGSSCSSNPPGGGAGGGVGRVRLNFAMCSFGGTAIVSPASTSATPACVR